MPFTITPIPQGNHSAIRRIGLGLAILGGFAGSWYFMNGMNTYGALVNDKLPEDYLKKVYTFPHKTTIIVGQAAAVGFAVVDAVLLFIFA